MGFEIKITGKNLPDKIKRNEALQNISELSTESLVMLSELLKNKNAEKSFKQHFSLLKNMI